MTNKFCSSLRSSPPLAYCSIIVDCAYSIVPAERISVMVLSDDRKSMTVFVSKDVKSLSISATKGVAGYVGETGQGDKLETRMLVTETACVRTFIQYAPLL